MFFLGKSNFLMTYCEGDLCMTAVFSLSHVASHESDRRHAVKAQAGSCHNLQIVSVICARVLYIVLNYGIVS